MPELNWTPELIANARLLAVGLIALVFMGVALGGHRKRRRARQQLVEQEARLEGLQQEQRTLQDALHESELRESRQEEQRKFLQAENGRLADLLREQKTEISMWQQQLDAVRGQAHHAEKQLETTLADRRALERERDDLRERLRHSEQTQAKQAEEYRTLQAQQTAEARRAEEALASLREVRLQLQESREAYARLEHELQQHNTAFLQLNTAHTELQTTLEKREEYFQEQVAQFSETRTALTREFELLANKIFEEKGRTFTQTSQSSIDTLLKPFREQIEGFQKRINEVHDASLQGNTSLNAEIKKVLEIGLQMSKEANNLTSALKGDSQQRGAWGEAQLRRTLEMSGLMEEAHYEVQSAFRDAEGRQRQTDYLIKLPDGKHIIIDSKVSLNAYDRAVGAETPEEYQLAMHEHVRAVRKHIDDLASKDYTNLVGMRSPSFVLMFMPIEPAYIEALKNNKDLFEYGYKKGIVLVSHTTLIPILRTVSNLWMIERSNAEAREISERAGEIYNQVCKVAEHLSKLGGTLSTASNHYNRTVAALVGKQGLYGKVDRFSQLSAKVTRTLPELEAAHMDFEAERLDMIVEPLEEPESEAVDGEACANALPVGWSGSPE